VENCWGQAPSRRGPLLFRQHRGPLTNLRWRGSPHRYSDTYFCRCCRTGGEPAAASLHTSASASKVRDAQGPLGRRAKPSTGSGGGSGTAPGVVRVRRAKYGFAHGRSQLQCNVKSEPYCNLDGPLGMIYKYHGAILLEGPIKFCLSLCSCILLRHAFSFPVGKPSSPSFPSRVGAQERYQQKKIILLNMYFFNNVSFIENCRIFYLFVGI
jgi:hypothetical protein